MQAFQSEHLPSKYLEAENGKGFDLCFVAVLETKAMFETCKHLSSLMESCHVLCLDVFSSLYKKRIQ